MHFCVPELVLWWTTMKFDSPCFYLAFSEMEPESRFSGLLKVPEVHDYRSTGSTTHTWSIFHHGRDNVSQYMPPSWDLHPRHRGLLAGREDEEAGMPVMRGMLKLYNITLHHYQQLHHFSSCLYRVSSSYYKRPGANVFSIICTNLHPNWQCVTGEPIST